MACNLYQRDQTDSFHRLTLPHGAFILNFMNNNHIGEQIRAFRHAKGISQDELARLSGVSYNTIVKLEKKDKAVNPTIGTLEKIAQVLGVEIRELIIKTTLFNPHSSKGV